MLHQAIHNQQAKVQGSHTPQLYCWRINQRSSVNALTLSTGEVPRPTGSATSPVISPDTTHLLHYKRDMHIAAKPAA